MVYAVVWGYAIVGEGLKFEGPRMTTYISAVVLNIGLSTLLQALLGHRMAMVSGPNVIPSLAIVAAYAAGGETYALQAFKARIWARFLIALALALGGTVLAIHGRGVWATLPPVFVIALGYIIFLALGRVNLDFVRQAPLLSFPTLFPYGWTIPSWDLVLIMLIVNLMSAASFYGSLHGYAGIIGEKVNESEERRSFTIFGLVETTLPGILGVPATVAYGENLGIVQLTRVAARAFIIVAAAIFVVLAFIGKFGALMAVMPKEVAGAVLLGIASTVIGIGAHILNTAPAFQRREQTLVGFSIFLSLGLHLVPHQTWEQTPRLIETIFSNPVISVIIFVLVFEKLIFPLSTDKREMTTTPTNEIQREKGAA